MRIGLLGGTFNPIHNGHLHIAEEIYRQCRLDQVWFVPSCRPPHKQLADDVAFTDRLAMIEAAIQTSPYFFACSIEGRRGGTSYTVDTLRELTAAHPQDEFFFIMGLDSFQEIDSWKDYPQLFDYAHIVVAARPGYSGLLTNLLPVAIADRFCYDADSKKLWSDTGFSVFFVAHTDRDISSTDIRHRISKHRSVSGLIPAAVESYIAAHALYQSDIKD